MSGNYDSGHYLFAVLKTNVATIILLDLLSAKLDEGRAEKWRHRCALDF